MEISKYNKSITYLEIEEANFEYTVLSICKIVKFENSDRLVELSNIVRKAWSKLKNIDEKYYNNNNLKAEAEKIINNIQQVERVIIKFLKDDILYSKFVLNLKEITEIALKNVNTSLQTINRHFNIN